MYNALSMVSEMGIEIYEEDGASIERIKGDLNATAHKIRALERQPQARRKLVFERMPNDRNR